MRRRHLLALSAGALAAPSLITSPARAAVETREQNGYRVRTYDIDAKAGLHDVACDAGNFVWATGQRSGTLILLDGRDGTTTDTDLGPGAAPHGVIVGSDGAAWVNEGGQNAIGRYMPRGGRIELFMVPKPNANLNT